MYVNFKIKYYIDHTNLYVINILILYIPGEGVFTSRGFVNGDFLLHYKGDVIKNMKHARRVEKEHEEAGLGCFMYFFKYKERTMW